MKDPEVSGAMSLLTFIRNYKEKGDGRSGGLGGNILSPPQPIHMYVYPPLGGGPTFCLFSPIVVLSILSRNTSNNK